MAKVNLMASAIAAYDAALASASPDWRAVAEALRAAMPERKARLALVRNDGCTDIVDYVPKRKATRVGPTMVVSFEDGTMVRATFPTEEGKPINAGYGLRVACSFYRTRKAWPLARTAASHVGHDVMAIAEADLRIAATLGVPAIRAAYVERDGDVLAVYDPAECNAHTAACRRGYPLARWQRRVRAFGRFAARRDMRAAKARVDALGLAAVDAALAA